MGDSAIASNSFVLENSRDAYLGAWWFKAVIAETGWDQVLFTNVSNYCRTKLLQTLDKSSIFSYACKGHRAVIVSAGQVAIEDFLKMRGSNKV